MGDGSMEVGFSDSFVQTSDSSAETILKHELLTKIGSF
jgi:hypothetical protein